MPETGADEPRTDRPITVALTRLAIDPAETIDAVRDKDAGAVVLFLGTVRETTDSVQTTCLRYDAYESMATAEMRRLAEEATGRWALAAVSMTHRLDAVDPGDVAVAVAVSAGHRQEAFDAGRWLIDTLKERVPIWKREEFADGRAEWVAAEPKS